MAMMQGTFTDRASADRAVDDLLSLGYRLDEISVTRENDSAPIVVAVEPTDDNRYALEKILLSDAERERLSEEHSHLPPGDPSRSNVPRGDELATHITQPDFVGDNLDDNAPIPATRFEGPAGSEAPFIDPGDPQLQSDRPR